VKICGVGRVEDALAAARAGADAVGMVFCPQARRNVAPQRAGEILAALPPFVTPVGLFMDLPIARVMDAARAMHLRHIQLHGGETPEQVAQLCEFTVLKAIRVDPDTFGTELEMWRKAISRLRLTHLQGFVLETAGVSGGSGVANNWDLIAHHRQRGDFVGLPHLIAAGGLTPQTVGDVVQRIHPWAVDVSSGVEDAPGEKSLEKMESFVRAVREAEDPERPVTKGKRSDGRAASSKVDQ
jgi:phosphoribosylanthranilate isomerase